MKNRLVMRENVWQLERGDEIYSEATVAPAASRQLIVCINRNFVRQVSFLPSLLFLMLVTPAGVHSGCFPFWEHHHLVG